MSTRFGDGHFIGSLLGSREVSGLTLAETEYAAGLRVPAHAHEHPLCCLVLEGSFTERAGRAAAPCEPGSLVFHPRDEPHAHDFHGAGGRCFNVVFGADWLARMERFDISPPTAPERLRRTRAGWIAGQLYHEFRTPDTASVIAIEGLALVLLGEIARSAPAREKSGVRPGWLIRAVEYLHAHFLEPVSLTELAARVDIAPTHLARTFRQHYGCTPSEYVRKLRVEWAQKELLSGSRSLSDIAYSAGFADQAHFTRVFKQSTGLTPGAYRQAAGVR